MFLKNCLSIKSPLGYNSSGEFLWETYKLSNKKYECFFGGNQFFQLLLLIAKNPAGKKEKNWCHFQEAFPYFDTYHVSGKIKNHSFLSC